MQLLASGKKRERFTIFKSWGRVGGAESGNEGGYGGRTNQSLKHAHEGDLEGAIKEFHEYFKRLACVSFLEAEPPCQHRGGYQVQLLPGQLGRDVTAEHRAAVAGRGAAASAAAARAAPSCTLAREVQSFVELIFSERMMASQLEAMNIDLDKMPLGAISDRQAQLGYEHLRHIAEALKTPLADAGAQAQKLLALTTSFYNAIPHKFARKQTPPVITTQQMLIEKIEAIEALLQVSQAQSLSRELPAAAPGAAAKHPADDHYAKLNCGLQPASAEELHMVEQYVRNTHAATHTQYKLKVSSVLQAKRDGETSTHQRQLGNRKLLWHGSRLTNWVGILSQGLRIAPPEAPVTGYMFGKGVYFADMVSKSANYCSGTRESPKVVLLLCDVALGEQYDRISSEYEAAERSRAKGKHSTLGLGKTAPDPSFERVGADGVAIPLGPGVPNAALNGRLDELIANGAGKRSELLYNEFIVYDTRQIRMKYVVVCDMDFSVDDAD